MKLRVGSIALLLIAIIGLASSASACEKCPSDYWGVKRCSSGHLSGSQSCYGGSGTACTLEGACGSGGGGFDDPGPFYPDYYSAVKPCLTCVGDGPAQGFVLRSEAPRPEAAAAASVLLRKAK